MMLTRRSIVAALGALAALPCPALAAGATELNFVPQSDLAGLDPIWNTQTALRNHGYMVFDLLFATDADLRIYPQMAESLDSEGLVSTIRLRPGLLFHDGEPVRARDCVASIRRWASRDPIGPVSIPTPCVPNSPPTQRGTAADTTTSPTPWPTRSPGCASARSANTALTIPARPLS